MNKKTKLILAMMCAVTGLGLGTTASAAEPAKVASNPDREAYFGQTHSHTSWSLDAYVIGNMITGPEEAYRFSLGEAIKHPGGFDVKLVRPLDFQGVTDHAEYVGMVKLANDPSSPISKLPIAAKLKVKDKADVNRVFQFLVASLAKQEPIKELLDPAAQGNVWEQIISIADKYNQPGKFTTFVSYEWTSAPNSQNMHRNIFFRDSKHVPKLPFSAIDSVFAEDLWAWMDTQRQAGNELLAISHNGNLSNGLMWPTEVDGKGKPIDAAWAKARLANEPLTEIHQIKGTSETTPQLSPTDEFADFENMSFLLGTPNSTSKPHGSYAREAYENGLAMQVAKGYNPYKFGMVGASDSHNTVVAYTSSNFFGEHGVIDATPEVRMQNNVESGMAVLKTSTSGLAGVWAESNTRESIFDSMKRKEVYGTSGVRIKVRLFGGWDYAPEQMKNADWVKEAYAKGVPMGGDLPASDGKKAPTFLVWAFKDPDDANLDRVQIIKGWTKDGKLFEKVYDVAWSGDRTPDKATGKVPAVGNSVDVANATYTNTIGSPELKTEWKDPDFEAGVHAFYYARVLQIPTPRWSTYDAAKLKMKPLADVPTTIQDRAWTSPIWYNPGA